MRRHWGSRSARILVHTRDSPGHGEDWPRRIHRMPPRFSLIGGPAQDIQSVLHAPHIFLVRSANIFFQPRLQLVLREQARELCSRPSSLQFLAVALPPLFDLTRLAKCYRIDFRPWGRRSTVRCASSHGVAPAIPGPRQSQPTSWPASPPSRSAPAGGTVNQATGYQLRSTRRKCPSAAPILHGMVGTPPQRLKGPAKLDLAKPGARFCWAGRLQTRICHHPSVPTTGSEGPLQASMRFSGGSVVSAHDRGPPSSRSSGPDSFVIRLFCLWISAACR